MRQKIESFQRDTLGKPLSGNQQASTNIAGLTISPTTGEVISQTNYQTPSSNTGSQPGNQTSGSNSDS